jgi:hypothetical protein
MSDIIDQSNWKSFLKKFAAVNEGKPTRLGFMEMHGDVANDYWIEEGLPLVGLDVYPSKGHFRVDIIFDNFTHSIDGATKLVEVGSDDVNYGLDILDAEGNTAVLRFEDWPARIED